MIDVGILGEPGFTPDVSRDAVASAAGGDLESLRRAGQRQEALSVMGRGLAVIARRLYGRGQARWHLGHGRQRRNDGGHRRHARSATRRA